MEEILSEQHPDDVTNTNLVQNARVACASFGQSVVVDNLVLCRRLDFLPVTGGRECERNVLDRHQHSQLLALRLICQVAAIKVEEAVHLGAKGLLFIRDGELADHPVQFVAHVLCGDAGRRGLEVLHIVE